MKKEEAEEGLKIGIFSFFSGSGFLDLGFEKSGYNVLFANEICKDFAQVYQYARVKMGISSVEPDGHSIDDFVNPETEQHAILKKKVEKARQHYDLIGFIGGPPCPDFSVAGKQAGSTGKHGRLSQVYMNLIFDFKPDFFVFENVRGLIKTARHKAFFEELRAQARAHDYFTAWKLTNALEYGVPQDRDRVIFIGISRKTLVDPSCTDKGEITDFPWLPEGSKTVKEIKKHPVWPKTDSFVEHENRECQLDVSHKNLTVMHWFDKNDVTNHPNAKHYFKPRAGRVKMEAYAEGDVSRKCFKRLHRWRYSPAAAYGNNEVHLHPFEVRRISVAEALAIQSLPKEFSLPDFLPLTSMFKTIGNGVPFLLAKGIAEALKKYLNANARSRMCDA